MKMTENKEIASGWTMMLCLVMEKKLTVNIQASKIMSLMRSGDFVFKVKCSDTNTYLVDVSDIFVRAIIGTSSLSPVLMLWIALVALHRLFTTIAICIFLPLHFD